MPGREDLTVTPSKSSSSLVPSHCSKGESREYRTINRGVTFLAVVWFGSSPPPPTSPSHLLPSESSTVVTKEDWERETSRWREKGRGYEAGAKSYDGEKALTFYKSLNTYGTGTLWVRPSLCIDWLIWTDPDFFSGCDPEYTF